MTVFSLISISRTVESRISLFRSSSNSAISSERWLSSVISSAVFFSYSLTRRLYSELAFSDRIFRSLRILKVESTEMVVAVLPPKVSLLWNPGGVGGGACRLEVVL